MDLSGRITLRDAVATGSGKDMTLHDLIRDLVKHGDRHILLNLRDVSYVDSSGIGELFGCLTTAQSHGGVLKVTHPNERVRNLLSLTRLNTVIEVIEDEATAVQSFAKAETA